MEFEDDLDFELCIREYPGGKETYEVIGEHPDDSRESLGLYQTEKEADDLIATYTNKTLMRFYIIKRRN